MRTFLLLTLLTTFINAEHNCRACINGYCYEEEFITNEYETPIVVDRKTNSIYFPTVASRDNDTDVVRQYNLDTKTHKDFVWSITDLTVDQNTGNVYAIDETKKEIYKLEMDKNEPTLFVHVDETISNILFKHVLYYIKHGQMYTYENGIEKKVIGDFGDNLIGNFVIDKNDDIYYSAEEAITDHYSELKVRRLKRGETVSSEFCDWLPTLVTDKDGIVFFINDFTRNIYKLDYETDKMTLVGAFVDDGTVIGFDRNNNVVYRKLDGIYNLKLKKSKDSCP